MESSSEPCFSIGDVLEILKKEFPDITISKIRFLESQGLLNLQRTPTGFRKFYLEDIERLRFVLTEQKQNYLPLKIIKSKLSSPNSKTTKSFDSTQQLPISWDERPLNRHNLDVKRPIADAPNDKNDVKTSEGHAHLGYGANPDKDNFSKDSRTWLEDTQNIPAELIDQLIKARIINPVITGGIENFTERDIQIAKLFSKLATVGLEPRHLLFVAHCAARQISLCEQALSPLLLSRNSDLKAQGVKKIGELCSIFRELSAILLDFNAEQLRKKYQ